MKLIEADKLCQAIHNYLAVPEASEKAIIKFIQNYHADCDIDKVIEQLEELKNTPPELQYKDITLQNAIEIVRRGGVDDR